MSKFVSKENLASAWAKIKAKIPTNTNQLTNGANFITASSNITGNAATATKATKDGNGNNIVDTYLTKAKLLWTNSSPNAAFSAKTVTLSASLANYTYVLIEYKNVTDASLVTYAITKVGKYAQLFYVSTTTGGPFTASRWVQYKSSTSIYIENAYAAQGTSSEAVDNNRLIPLNIYAFK